MGDTLQIVSTEEFVAAGFEERWGQLLARCQPHDLGQTYAWNKAWWRSFQAGVSRKDLFVVQDARATRLEALWPLFRRQRHGLRTLHWLGQTEGLPTDYMMPLLPAEHRDKAAPAFFEFLGARRADWDVLDVVVPLWSGLFSVLLRAAVVHGPRAGLRWATGLYDHSAAIQLPPTFDGFLKAMGSKTRADLRQYLRAAEESGARLDLLEGPAAVAALPELFRLNGTRWNVFASEQARAFMTGVFESSAPAACKQPSLVALRWQGETLAIAVGYESNGACFLHSAGVLRDKKCEFSPGMTLYALLIRRLIETHHTRLDMSTGLEEYKLRLGAVVEPVFRLTFWHNDSTMRRWRLWEWLRKAKRFLRSGA